jgi:hypothetical protein
MFRRPRNRPQDVKLTINTVYVLHPKHYGKGFEITGRDAWRETAISSVRMYSYQLRERLAREGKLGNVIRERGNKNLRAQCKKDVVLLLTNSEKQREAMPENPIQNHKIARLQFHCITRDTPFFH